MPEAKHMTSPSPYASRGDFCRIFHEDMNSLYMLSFLLTADLEKAERCFVSGLEGAADGNPVFKEWARSWARRAIIQNAVRLINPRPNERSHRSTSTSADSSEKTLPAERKPELAAVLRLEPFERFVYVMTVLEHYSDHECSLLLGCARRDVLVARSRAFEQLGSAMEKHDQQLTDAGAQSPALHGRHSSVFQLLVAASLLPSA